ncbi:unnamed protein product [Mytilus coruscus]|uniref:Reverse transcriptase domain-containing protein n=1 Tax=Mytilus coruscus TaxID=42192 RepID=A0A6J8DTH1_MYTCO|nr:unnamed protein product [Mytilus coruscus]
MQVVFDQLNVAALINTGSSINVISKNLFDSISDKLKISFEQLSDPEIRLANNEKIKVFGTAKLKAIIHDQEQIIDIYILPTVSHPLILGTEYLRTHKVLLDFSDFSYGVKNIHVQTTKKIFIEPNTELLTNGKVPNFVMQCLYENRDLFVTKDNPNLGFTSLIEHKINLKPNAVSKHQNPYRLPPYKREILREQLDDLLRQGIITPVSESEELPITSPVVLVTKRSANADKKESQNFRFCCDFRHLNAQTEDFKYVIPNLQELTESMSDLVPNFITSIDLSSGFFQMGISPDSTRYTAF